MRFTARARLGAWAHASRVQSDEVTYDLERTVVGSVVASATADRCGQCGACDRALVPVAVGNGEAGDMEVKNVLDRAQAWLDEADKRGINLTDEYGYLAVIRDLSMEVRRLGALVPSNAIAWQERATESEKEMRLAYRLLQRVLSCGLNEEPHGSGFTPSKQERLAGELARDIMDFVSKHAALVRGEGGA